MSGHFTVILLHEYHIFVSQISDLGCYGSGEEGSDERKGGSIDQAILRKKKKLKKVQMDNILEKMKKTLNRTRKHGLASTSRIERKEREDRLTTDVDVVETTKKDMNKRKEREDQSMSEVDVGKTNKKVYMNKGKGKQHDVWAHEDFDSTVGETRQVIIFSTNIHSVLKDVGRESLIGIYLIFIPILHSKHYYLMCFDLKKAQIDVIDNLGSNVDFNVKYAYQTQVMKHQLNDLRLKYLTKILLSEINLHKDAVEAETGDYDGTFEIDLLCDGELGLSPVATVDRCGVTEVYDERNPERSQTRVDFPV
ncbi:hypothetical protein L1987_46417 [Smallanthus sonchifolius]|uniref:Uncharacterized protein n=1 Tax=Smallanthus sonchifolius TaxID=185202 RepID=A0ACB9G087_9ASTR|nr:hypothetical protein L1987_46417 [Smallanthus sonchifolius]